MLPKPNAARLPGGGVAAVGGGIVGITARKAARVAAIAKNLHLEASDVDCVPVHMFLSSPHSQTRCFIVKINGGAKKKETPYPVDELNGQVIIGGRFYLVYSSTHLCALQMLLNKAVGSTAPLAPDQIGSAFVQIIVPHAFNWINNHKKDMFTVCSYILRNMFAHMREQSFRNQTRKGGILTATKLWLQEDVCDSTPADAKDEGFWRPFDIAEYVFHGSYFAYVFPLCYRHIRESLRLRKEFLSPRYHETVLKCMPAASPDFEIPSSLDWYFDHEGEACSLRVLMAINDADLNVRLRDGSPPAAHRGAKSGRHKNASKANSFYGTFLKFLKLFFDMTQRLKIEKQKAQLGPAASKNVFFCRDASFSIDSTNPPHQGLVWLGLGKEETVIETGIITGQKFYKPVAIKSRQNVDPETFSRVMRQMKPGSFIASAQEMQLDVHVFGGQVGAPSPMSPGARGLHDRPSSDHEAFLDAVCTFPAAGGADAQQRDHHVAAAAAAAGVADGKCDRYWVSEAGVCTLHELFENGVPEEERSTQSHRRLVKEVRCVASECNVRGCAAFATL